MEQVICDDVKLTVTHARVYGADALRFLPQTAFKLGYISTDIQYFQEMHSVLKCSLMPIFSIMSKLLNFNSILVHISRVCCQTQTSLFPVFSKQLVIAPFIGSARRLCFHCLRQETMFSLVSVCPLVLAIKMEPHSNHIHP